jgi:hypothetical protein
MNCPVCETPFCGIKSQEGDKTFFECAACGTFAVAGSALKANLNGNNAALTPVKRAAISHRLREATDAGQQPLLTTYEVDGLIADARLPSAAQQATNLIRYVGDQITNSGKQLNDFPHDIDTIIGSPNRDFALRIARQLVQRGLLDGRDSGHLGSAYELILIDLTLEGWGLYEAERRGKVSGTYGFIALKFGDPTLDPFLRDVIKPAVQDIGFTLEDMRDAARAGVIDNVMRARIRDAAFVLVDLTHANEGAYWEAGYAEGLGKPVLYLCKQDVFQAQGTHFDTNHCTTVQWRPDKPELFADELKATLRRSLDLFSS